MAVSTPSPSAPTLASRSPRSCCFLTAGVCARRSRAWRAAWPTRGSSSWRRTSSIEPAPPRRPQARHAAVKTVLDPDAQADDFEAWLHGLEAERLVDDTRIGLLGYGVGAALALRLAALHAERIAAAAIFYGGRPTSEKARHLAACVNAVLHLGHAEGDAARPGLLEAALRREGVDFESLGYRAPRGFAVPDHPSYAPEAAARHWTSLTELFRRTLGEPKSGPASASGHSEDGIFPQGSPRSLL